MLPPIRHTGQQTDVQTCVEKWAKVQPTWSGTGGTARRMGPLLTPFRYPHSGCPFHPFRSPSGVLFLQSYHKANILSTAKRNKGEKRSFVPPCSLSYMPYSVKQDRKPRSRLTEPAYPAEDQLLGNPISFQYSKSRKAEECLSYSFKRFWQITSWTSW